MSVRVPPNLTTVIPQQCQDSHYLYFNHSVALNELTDIDIFSINILGVYFMYLLLCFMYEFKKNIEQSSQVFLSCNISSCNLFLCLRSMKRSPFFILVFHILFDLFQISIHLNLNTQLKWLFSNLTLICLASLCVCMSLEVLLGLSVTNKKVHICLFVMCSSNNCSTISGRQNTVV